LCYTIFLIFFNFIPHHFISFKCFIQFWSSFFWLLFSYHFLDFFSSILSLNILLHLISLSNFGHSCFDCFFFIIFLIYFVFSI
jgi:hypothetical protein